MADVVDNAESDDGIAGDAVAAVAGAADDAGFEDGFDDELDAGRGGGFDDELDVGLDDELGNELDAGLDDDDASGSGAVTCGTGVVGGVVVPVCENCFQTSMARKRCLATTCTRSRRLTSLASSASKSRNDSISSLLYPSECTSGMIGCSPNSANSPKNSPLPNSIVVPSGSCTDTAPDATKHISNP